MSSVNDFMNASRSIEELQPMLQGIPYARYLGFSVQRDGSDAIVRMPFRDDLVGNASLRAVHGGALGALMEFAAVCQLMTIPGIKVVPKTVNITVEYLRGTQPVDTFARAIVTRQGRRVANVRVLAYQADAGKPVAAANAHFLLPAGAPSA
jgi:uncharacterized protein (TIGR00369 family)